MWLPGTVAKGRAHFPGASVIKAAEVELRSGVCGNAIAAVEEEESWQMVGTLPAGTTRVTFTVTISPSAYFHDGDTRWTGEIALPVRLIDPAPPAPVDSSELTALMRGAANVSCSNGFFDDGPSVWLSSSLARRPDGPLADTLAHLEMSLLRGDTVVYTRCASDPDELYGEARWQLGGFLHGEIARQIVMRQDIAGFTVRVRGLPPPTANQWCRTKYWSGEFTTPLQALMEPECGMRPAGLCGPEGTPSR